MESLAGLSYVHHVPPAVAAAAQPAPAVILLHGRGADETDLMGLVPALPPTAIYAAVRAPLPFAYGGFGWFVGDASGYPDSVSFLRSLGLLQAFLSALPARLPLDPERVAVVGFSQGAAMAAALALSAQAPARAFGILSGFLPADVVRGGGPQPAGRVTRFAFVAHGSFDPVIPVQAAQMVRDRLAEHGIVVTYRLHAEGHRIGEEILGELAAWLRQVLDLDPPAATARVPPAAQR